jgi:hypothetical protein
VTPIPSTGSVFGTVFDDLNGDGVLNAGEPGLAEALVGLTQNYALRYVTVSQTNGSYVLENVAPGCYQLYEVLAPSGYYATTPPTTVCLSPGQQLTGYNLANRRIPTDTPTPTPSHTPRSGRAYLPLVVQLPPIPTPTPSRTLQPTPAAPTLIPISNPDGDGNYIVIWSSASFASSYTLQEATNPAFADASQPCAGPDTSCPIHDRWAARFYYRVRGHNSSGAGSWSNTQAADVLWEREPNDNARTQANGPIVSGLTYYGAFLDQADLKDYFYFDLLTTHTVELWLTHIPAGQDYDLVLRDANLEQRGLSNNPGNADEHILTGPLPAGRYYVQVYRYGGPGSPQPYHLRGVWQ